MAWCLVKHRENLPLPLNSGVQRCNICRWGVSHPLLTIRYFHRPRWHSIADYFDSEVVGSNVALRDIFPVAIFDALIISVSYPPPPCLRRQTMLGYLRTASDWFSAYLTTLYQLCSLWSSVKVWRRIWIIFSKQFTHLFCMSTAEIT
jgi:hypothetical protein